jgi:hypothetical protein
MSITEANHVWAMDTTHIPMRHGFVYLVGLISVARAEHMMCVEPIAQRARNVLYTRSFRARCG